MDKLEIMLKKIAPIIMNCQKKTAIPSRKLKDNNQKGIIISLYFPLLYVAAEFFYEKVHGNVTLFVVVVGYM